MSLNVSGVSKMIAVRRQLTSSPRMTSPGESEPSESAAARSICRQLRQGLLPVARLSLFGDEDVGPLAPVVPLMMVDGAYWLTRAARRAVSAIVSARAMNSDATAPTS